MVILVGDGVPPNGAPFTQGIAFPNESRRWSIPS